MAKKRSRKRRKVPARTLARARASAAASGAKLAEHVLEELRRRERPRARARRAGLLVAEGDSWFDYGFRDILDKLEDVYGYDVESVAHWGHTIESMAYDENQLAALARRLRKVARRGERPKAVLLSGGGNDIAGDEFSLLLNNKASNLPMLNEEVVRGLIDVRLDVTVTSLVGSIRHFCERIFGTVVPILLHGYSYPVPDGRGVLGGAWLLPGPWLQPGFRSKGYDDPEANTAAMEILIDRYNVVLANIARRRELRGFVRYVNLLDLLSNELARRRYQRWWANELHPKERGFASIAARFHNVLRELP